MDEPTPKPIIVTKRTIVVTQETPLSDYGGFTPQDAMDYEKNMDTEDSVQAVIEALQFGAEYVLDTHCYVK
jgi:hypothetical protein